MATLFTIVEMALLAITLVLMVPVLVLLIQVLAARRPAATSLDIVAARARVAVLMPAHNEAGGIAEALATVLPQLRAGDRVLVIADNCSDDTAAIAAACGAQVVVRTDVQRRGKGYALDHGMHELAAAPPEVVLIVDADCRVEAGSVDRLVAECTASGRPVQALYLMQSPPGAGLKTRVAEFAWAVRNEARPLGCARLGWPCQLMGTGMAFPWALIATAPLASGHIVEDMQLGLDLAAAGAPPRFCHAARVTSVFPESAEGTVAQRTRWEHGHLSMIASRGVPLLLRGIARGRPALIAMALDLCVPPLASLVLMIWIATLGAAALFAIGGMAWPLALCVLMLALVALAIAVAWQRVARHIISLRELLSVPGYVVAKIPIYAKLFTARQMEWVRTKRDGHPK
jgi:cellulose synthase/poly-beta-1,6-N-acetylglucosamine synthase-like glycosyltransferase